MADFHNRFVCTVAMPLALLTCVACPISGIAGVVTPQTKYWNRPSDPNNTSDTGLWLDGVNWTPTGAPLAEDTAVLNLDHISRVAFSADASIRSVEVEGGVEFHLRGWTLGISEELKLPFSSVYLHGPGTMRNSSVDVGHFEFNGGTHSVQKEL